MFEMTFTLSQRFQQFSCEWLKVCFSVLLFLCDKPALILLRNPRESAGSLLGLL